MILRLLIIAILSSATTIGVKAEKAKLYNLHTMLEDYVTGKDVRIGVAVIIESRDTISVNGTREFPMMSVFKFPLALAVSRQLAENGSTLDEEINISVEDLKDDTYSPMLEKYGKTLNHMTINELMEWSLKESDNNAADILLKYVGGPGRADSIMRLLTVNLNITIGASEDDMHRDPYLSYLNRSTPLAMAALFDRFDREIKNQSLMNLAIAEMLESCNTGQDRLSAPLASTGTIIGHKTGTGFTALDGRISALNDCGYIHLLDGRRYTIAVFIADSAYDIEMSSKIIADISEIVFTELNNEN